MLVRALYRPLEWLFVPAGMCAGGSVHVGLAAVWTGGFGQDGPWAPLGAMAMAGVPRIHVLMGEFLAGLAVLGQRPRMVVAPVLLAVLFDRTLDVAATDAEYG